MSKIIDIANTYLKEYDELPLLVVARNESGERIIRCHLREKHAQADQTTFINVMRLASIIYGFTEYEYILKPEFNYKHLQMTVNVWIVGKVSAVESETRAEFFELDNDKLVPYFQDMPVGGCVTQILPSKAERKKIIPQKVENQIRKYIENCTYTMPIVEVKEAIDGLETLMNNYKRVEV